MVIVSSKAEADVLRWILDRALNTLEPEKWPPFAKDLDAGLLAWHAQHDADQRRLQQLPEGNTIAS